MPARQVMQYPGPPRVGADRSSSDQDGLSANGILWRSLESLPSLVLLSELNRGQHERFRSLGRRHPQPPRSPLHVLFPSNFTPITRAGPQAGPRLRRRAPAAESAISRRRTAPVERAITPLTFKYTRSTVRLSLGVLLCVSVCEYRSVFDLPV